MHAPVSQAQPLQTDGPMYLGSFHSIRPRLEEDQATLLDRVATAHARAEAAVAGKDFDEERFTRRMRKLITRYGCDPKRIARRGFELEDERRIGGALMRSRFYERVVSAVIHRFYAEEPVPPDDLIHVTCTGYVSPSPAQKLVQEKGWHRRTRVTHAYHMGCYASVPALRQAEGFLSSGTSGRVDLTHTELCSLHFNPLDHASEQLVVQGLFADGYIRYSALNETKARGNGRPVFRVMALHEEILRGTTSKMSWICADWGMTMTLARDVPALIGAALEGFTSELHRKAGLGDKSPGLFAIHPGGPKIIDGVEQTLGLDREQTRHSHEVLLSYGNMSSATLPHIWRAILEDPGIAIGTTVTSLAFGPGLTLCGSVFEKVI